MLVVILAVAGCLPCCSRFSRSLDIQLKEAVCGGDVGQTKNLLALGANVNATDADGYSALVVVEACAAHKDPRRAELVELLIANGAQINRRARDGSDALMYAARNGDSQAVKALLKAGASVKTADNQGETALIKAVTFSCDEQTVRTLIEAGADLKATNHKGQSALSSSCLTDRLGELLHPAADQSVRQK
jgi:uncharacterized protein